MALSEYGRRMLFGAWIDWHGGDCPVREYESIEVRYRSGGTTEMQANRLRWMHTGGWDDVIAYRERRPERNNQ